nr:hypothetical protein [Tanacetum cinerariifolium]
MNHIKWYSETRNIRMSGIDHSQPNRRFTAGGNGYDERDPRDAEIERLRQLVCELETNSFDRYDEKVDNMETNSVVNEHEDTDDGKIIFSPAATIANTNHPSDNTYHNRDSHNNCKTFSKFSGYPRAPTAGPTNTRVGPIKANSVVLPTTQIDDTKPKYNTEEEEASKVPYPDQGGSLFLEASQAAFERLKKMITEAPVLALPNFDHVFQVECDDSGLGIGNSNTVADTLSRRPALKTSTTIQVAGFEPLKQLYIDDPDFKDVWEKCGVAPFRDYVRREGLLFKGHRLCVPLSSFWEAIIVECHQSYAIFPRLITPTKDCTRHYQRQIVRGNMAKLQFSSSHHLQTNGQTKVTNRSLDNLLRCLVGDNKNQWDLALPQAEFAYKRSTHSSMGRNPFLVVYGRNPFTPLDLAPLSRVETFSAEGNDRVEQIKSLHEQRINGNAYKIDLPGHYGVSDTFNMADLSP